MNEDLERLTGHYATGLSAEERRLLLEAALDDQEVFDRLVDEDALAELLEDASARESLLAQLRARPRPASGGRVWMWPVGGALAAAAVIAVVALLGPGLWRTPAPVEVDPTSRSRGRGLSSGPSLVSRAFSWTLATPLPAKLVINRPGEAPTYRIGDPMRLGFVVEQDANVFVVEQAPDLSVRTLFPASGYERVSAGQEVLIPPRGAPDLQVEGAPGVYRIRLVAAPVDVAIGDLGQGRMTVLERTYVVEVAP